MKIPLLSRLMIFLAVMLQNLQVQAMPPAYIRDARLSWAAFECSALAELAGNAEDEKRLRALGLQRGRAFLKATREANLTIRQLEDIVPYGMIPSLKMDSPELAIGSYSRAAGDSALERAEKRRNRSEAPALRINSGLFKLYPSQLPLNPVRPNPSLKLTRYGMSCKPGVCQFHHHHTPGLQHMPPRAA